MKALRLGLVGAGRWGRNYIRTIAGLRGMELARVASRNPETPALVPAGCKVVADWRELLGEVDAVIVAAPPAAHEEIVLGAIAAGRPVLVEKPLALSVEAAERIASAAAARSVLVMVDHVHLFHPAWEALKQAVARQGPVRSIEAAAGDLGPYRADVGTLWDWGPHDVAMCIDLLGVPQAVDAERLEARPEGGALAERLRLELRFASGVGARIILSTLDAKHRRFAVALAGQTLLYDAAPPALAAELPLARALRSFAGAVAQGSCALEQVRLGAAVVRVLALCEQRLAAKSDTFARQS